MPATTLQNMTIAILADDGFEQIELTEPRKALDDAGAKTVVISPQVTRVRGWNHTEWGDRIDVDVRLADANAGDYAALLLPGGVMNPDHLRMNDRAVAFVKAFLDAGKPIAAICHAPWTLLEAGGVKGRRMTSWPSLRTDLRNAGALWVDEAEVVDRNLVTSRRPDDIPAFNREMLALFESASERSRR